MFHACVAITQMAQMLLAVRRGHAAAKAYAKALLSLSAVFTRMYFHKKTPVVSYLALLSTFSPISSLFLRYFFAIFLVFLTFTQ